jgi:hypothetical protein
MRLRRLSRDHNNTGGGTMPIARAFATPAAITLLAMMTGSAVAQQSNTSFFISSA